MSINIFSLYDAAYNSSIRRMSGATSDYRNYVKQLAGGMRINSAADDAAGLFLGTKLNTVLMATNVAKNNTQTGLNMLNVADGALGGMVDSLQRVRSLALQAANGVYSASERAMLQQEITALTADIKQSYESTKFADKKLFEENSANNIKPVTPQTDTEMLANGYDEAHIIRNASDFISKITGHESENFILSGDINLSSLGTKNNSIIANFSGQFDGNGYVISGFNINTGGAAVNNIGLFGVLSGSGLIKNLGIEGFSVTATNSDSSGGLVGQINGGTVDNCYANGNINAYMNTGLLIGYNNGGQVTYSYSEGSTTGTGWSAAGLVGWNDNGGLVSKSYSKASVINAGGFDAGGVVAYNSGGSTVAESYFSGTVTSVSTAFGSIGGIVASNDTSTVTNCYNTGDISATGGAGSNVGGVVGLSWGGGPITKSYSTGTVNGPGSIGGVIGSGSADATNFYKNNLSTDGGSSVDANVSPMPTSGWDTNVWDLSSALPTIKSLNSVANSSTRGSTLQVGAYTDNSSQVDVDMAFHLGSMNFNVNNADSALTTIDQVDELINFLCEKRSVLGAQGNKLESILVAQDNRIEGYSKSKSNIMDADMAKAQSELVKQQLLQNFASNVFQQSKNINKNLMLTLLS